MAGGQRDSLSGGSAGGAPAAASETEVADSSGDVDAPSAERIDMTPTAWNVEQRQHADAARQRRIDDEMLADRIEPEHRPQEQERRSRRPRLRAACRRVLDGIPGDRALVTAERLGKAAVE